jgi:DnaJ-class molecular chaperone
MSETESLEEKAQRLVALGTKKQELEAKIVESYAILECERGESDREKVMRQYDMLSRKWHPDMCSEAKATEVSLIQLR